MRITIEATEKSEALLLLKANNILRALKEFDDELRRMYKYEEKNTIDIPDARGLLAQCLTDHCVDLEELPQ